MDAIVSPIDVLLSWGWGGEDDEYPDLSPGRPRSILPKWKWGGDDVEDHYPVGVPRTSTVHVEKERVPYSYARAERKVADSNAQLRRTERILDDNLRAHGIVRKQILNWDFKKGRMRKELRYFRHGKEIPISEYERLYKKYILDRKIGTFSDKDGFISGEPLHEDEVVTSDYEIDAVKREHVDDDYSSDFSEN